jgi:Sec-independent protein translocase protein TatA
MSVIYIAMEYGGMALAIVLCIVAVILFIKWNIPKVCGEVTGTTQKKAIERIRKEGYESHASKQAVLQKNKNAEAIREHKTNIDELDDIQSVVLPQNAKQDELTMVLAVPTDEEMAVSDVIEVAEEVYTQPGSVAKVLDIVITHTKEEIV